MQRNELRELSAFYIGHGKFRKHLQNMRLAEDSKCKFCDEDEIDLTDDLTNGFGCLDFWVRGEEGEVLKAFKLKLIRYWSKIGKTVQKNAVNI